MNEQLEKLAEYAANAEAIARTATTQAVRAAAHLVCATVRSVYPTAAHLTFYDERDTPPMVDRITDKDGAELDTLPDEIREWAFENAVNLLCRDSNISTWSSDMPFTQYPSLSDFSLNISNFIPEEGDVEPTEDEIEDWSYEVMNRDTSLDLREWVTHRRSFENEEEQ